MESSWARMEVLQKRAKVYAYHFCDIVLHLMLIMADIAVPPPPVVCTHLHLVKLQRGWYLYYCIESCANLAITQQPVSEALTPIFNQLQTVQRCLKEVQKYGIQHPRDLYPYSMKVSDVDIPRYCAI